VIESADLYAVTDCTCADSVSGTGPLISDSKNTIEVDNMRHDPLSDALVTIKNADHVGKDSANVPASRLIGEVLKLLTEKGYLNNYEFKENGQGGEFTISLNGRINGCGAIKPRFSIKVRDMERHEARYLPAKDFGILILTTPYGVMNNNQAKEASTGGKLLAYVY